MNIEDRIRSWSPIPRIQFIWMPNASRWRLWSPGRGVYLCMGKLSIRFGR